MGRHTREQGARSAAARPLVPRPSPSQAALATLPWSAYRDKYKLWKWDWPGLYDLIVRLRREHFDAAVSVRPDPRDHLLMWLIGARRRYGFPLKGSTVFLTDPLLRSKPKQHKVEDWRDIGRALKLPEMDTAEPPPKYAAFDRYRLRTRLIYALL